MNDGSNNNELLAALAERLKDNPRFMAYALAVYKKTKNIDDLALCQRLGTMPEMIVRLALCKRPQRLSFDFADQVRELSDFTLIDEVALNRIIEHADRLSEQAQSARKRGIRLILDWQTELLVRTLHRSADIIRAHSLIFASILSALLLFAGFNFWREYTKRPSLPIVSNNTDPVSRPSETELSSEPQSKNTPVPNKRASHISRSQGGGVKPQQLIAQVSIDLEEHARLRAVDVEEKPINLPQSRARLLLNMPEGSSKGLYTVSITDAFGDPLLSKTAASPDGKSLRVILDTSGLQEKKYVFCISRKGEIPDCYALLITRMNKNL
ncbi:MAG TPA: hypothetical protein VLR90_08100 [Blastocatellia bacterium]|nr:hypothetical protein [Blastocatellia bacterium]